MTDLGPAGGRCFEDFTVGLVMRHPLGRTVTATDNIWSSLTTVNTNPIHFDAHYASQTEFGRPLMNSCFTLALVTGLSVADVSRNAVNLGWDEVRMPAPVFEGDTIYARTEVLSARESKSPPSTDCCPFCVRATMPSRTSQTSASGSSAKAIQR